MYNSQPLTYCVKTLLCNHGCSRSLHQHRLRSVFLLHLNHPVTTYQDQELDGLTVHLWQPIDVVKVQCHKFPCAKELAAVQVNFALMVYLDIY